jgi:membrane associated rhomboid family serine protease
VATIGASGAISGLLAAYIVCFPRGRILTGVFIGFLITTVMVPAWMMIGYWIVLQVISGVVSLGPDTSATQGGVAFFAHIGGFIAGLILVFPFRQRERVELQRASRAEPHPRLRRAQMG